MKDRNVHQKRQGLKAKQKSLYEIGVIESTSLSKQTPQRKDCHCFGGIKFGIKQLRGGSPHVFSIRHFQFTEEHGWLVRDALYSLHRRIVVLTMSLMSHGCTIYIWSEITCQEKVHMMLRPFQKLKIICFVIFFSFLSNFFFNSIL